MNGKTYRADIITEFIILSSAIYQVAKQIESKDLDWPPLHFYLINGDWLSKVLHVSKPLIKCYIL